MLAIGLTLALVIGLAVGLLGGGGSILTVPVLHDLLGIAAHEAIAMSLVVVGATSAVALILHARAGRVRWGIGLVFGAASMTAAFTGGWLRAALPERGLMIAFALVMLAAGGAMLARRPGGARRQAGGVRLGRALAIGLGVGLVTGTLGAGGGFLIVPSLAMIGGLAIGEAVGTSLLVIAMNALAGWAGTALTAPVAVPHAGVTAAVTGLAIAGALAGARLGGRLSAQALQRTFGWFVIAVGAFVLLRVLA